MTTYQILSIILSILSLFGLGTASSLVWKDIHDKKVQNSEKKLNESKRERQEEIKSVLQEELAPLKEKEDKIEGSIHSLENSLRCTLRDRLLEQYKTCSKSGYRTTEESLNWEQMYEAYDKLKGNSFIHDLKNQFENIDTYEEYVLKNKKERAK